MYVRILFQKETSQMIAFLVTIHIIVSISLIIIVLLQAGKGAEMGATFGTGGSQSLFGVGGGATLMSKLTTGAAIVFMLTSLLLAYLSSKPATSSIMPANVNQTKSAPKQAAPVQAKPPVAPVTPQQAPKK
jgi:preprotein translocase subunit SecG